MIEQLKIYGEGQSSKLRIKRDDYEDAAHSVFPFCKSITNLSLVFSVSKRMRWYH